MSFTIENKDEYCKEKDNIPQILTLPNEIIYEIFSHLSFETLHFSLRMVCRKMKCLVNRLTDVGGLFILLSKRKRNDQQNQLIDVIQTPNKSFKIKWKSIPCTPNESFFRKICTEKCQTHPSAELCYHTSSYEISRSQRTYQVYDEYFYFNAGDKVFCLHYHRKKFILYRYNVMNNNWDTFSDKSYNVKCNHIDYCPRSKFILNFEIRKPKHKPHPINLQEGVPDYRYQHSVYQSSPFLRLSKDGINNVQTKRTYEAWFCMCHIYLKSPKELETLELYSVLRIGPQRLMFVGGIWTHRINGRIERTEGQSGEVVNLVEHPNTSHNFINRHVIQVDLNSREYIVSWKSKYIDEMPYRPNPFCFKLKNNLYIAGHRSIRSFDNHLNEKERRLMCTSCPSFTSYTNKNKTKITSKEIICCCCDKFDLSEEKYYRNICSLPRPITNLIDLKVTTNKKESLALIDFYDPMDCRDKIWIFTEKDEKFEEHWDPNSEPCLDCKEDPRNTNFFGDGFMMGHHRVHPSWKMKIMNIQ